MSRITIILGGENSCQSIPLGRVGENEVTEVEFDYTLWAEEYGSGALTLTVKRPGETEKYLVALEAEGTKATWVLELADLALEGFGEAEATYNAGEKIKKSKTFETIIINSMDGDPGDPPDPMESWLEEMRRLTAQTIENAQAAAGSAQSAAQNATDAAASEAAAEASASEAAASAEAAETAAEHAPKIESGNWYVWSTSIGAYVDTGIAATGPQGPQGEIGATGPQGPTGPQGQTGNGIASITLTGTEGKVDTYTITYTDGSTSTFTVTNGEVSQADLDAVIADVAEIKEDLSDVQSEIIDIEIEQIIKSNIVMHMTHTGAGDYVADSARNSMITPLYTAYEIKVTISGAHDGAYQLYDGFTTGQSHLIYASPTWVKEFVIPADSYFCILIRNSDNSTTDESTTESISAESAMPINERIVDLYDALKSDETLNTLEVEYKRGTINADGTIADGNGATAKVIYPYIFEVGANCWVGVRLYSKGVYLGKLNNNNALDKVPGNWKQLRGTVDVKTMLLDAFDADVVELSIIPTDGTIITSNTVQDYGDTHLTVKREEYVPFDFMLNYITPESTSSNNYVVGADMMKRKVYSELVGELSYVQAFCIYNGSFYSTDGSNIAVQDSSFTQVQTASINIGHGNSLQLGAAGIAYASGWNDNKIYVVDLNTLIVVDEIVLPTTGYTTGVVDASNGMAYVFQRDSYPDTETNYTFIAYDYVNDAVKSTRQLSASFGAMQACDLYDDKIIVLNGLGTVAIPNGCRVYDLSGNMLAQYIFDDYKTTEPEGVAIDRDDGVLYISDIYRNVYKVTN